MAGKSNNGMRDIIVVISVMIIFVIGYFLLRTPQIVPTPPNQAANAGDMGGHQAMGGMDQLGELPSDYNGLVGVGNKNMDAGNYSVAAECYRRALNIDNSDYNVRTDFGACLHFMGLDERALEEFRAVIRHDEEHTIARFNAGIVHHDLGNLDSAKYYFEKYISMDPNGPAAAQAKSIMERLNQSNQ